MCEVCSLCVGTPMGGHGMLCLSAANSLASVSLTSFMGPHAYASYAVEPPHKGRTNGLEMTDLMADRSGGHGAF